MKKIQNLLIVASIFVVSHAMALGGGYYAGQKNIKHKYERMANDAYIASSIERDKAYAIHRGNLAARDVQIETLRDRNASLNSLLQSERKQRNTGTEQRPDDTYPDWFAGFEACHREYIELGYDASQWADRVNGLQLYVQAIQKK